MNKYQALNFIPEELSSYKTLCENCDTSFRPDWLKPRSCQMGSIEAQDGYLQRLTALDKCPSCDYDVEIKIPAKNQEAQVLLFGDEAARKLNNVGGRLNTYSLIGTSLPQLDRIENEIRSLKRQLNPHMEPDEWKIHMTKIWSGQQRKKKPEYSNWNYETTKALIGGVKEILENDDDKIFRYNIVLAGQPSNPKEEKAFENYIFHEAYILLIISVIKEITGLGGQPMLNFDSIKNSKSDIVIHEWAQKAFDHGTSNLLYSFISHSILVPEPVFVQPASRPFLELADIMSFSVAKHHYRLSKGKYPDIDLDIFGKVMYMTFNEDGSRLLQRRQAGYPWKLNYGK